VSLSIFCIFCGETVRRREKDARATVRWGEGEYGAERGDIIQKKVESGKWKVEGGRWKAEGGKRRKEGRRRMRRKRTRERV